MNLSRERVERWSTETGFRVETLEKVLRLGELAADISRHPLLGHVLALKGGTALNPSRRVCRWIWTLTISAMPTASACARSVRRLNGPWLGSVRGMVTAFSGLGTPTQVGSSILPILTWPVRRIASRLI